MSSIISPAMPSAAARREFLQRAAGAVGMALLPAWAGAADATPRLRVRLARISEAPANSAAAADGAFRVRVLRASSALPMRLDAVYAQASHRYWYAWEQQGEVQYSPSSWVRWEAPRAGGLPMTLVESGATAEFSVPARAGTYLLAVAARGAALPDLNRFALDQDDCRRARLVCRADGGHADFPYLLLAVESTIS